MTRQEAVAKIKQNCSSVHLNLTANIDMLVALGVLKLDEPKSVEDRACDALRKYGHSPACIWALQQSGLRIVDARSQGEG